MLLTADPSPVNEVPVIAPALNSPEVPRSTMVEAPLALAAVVRAFDIVPDEMLEALIAVSATPLPDMDVVVTAFAVKFPEESRATIVEAPLADAAVVLVLSIVPLVMFEALILVKLAPLPTTTPVMVTKFPTLAEIEPSLSLATIVEAPLADDAVVRALSIVPLDMLLAFMAVKAAPLPDTDVVVIAFAVKFPLASLATMVFAPLAEFAVVYTLPITLAFQVPSVRVPTPVMPV
jgi:hypothetical protein